MGYFEISVTQVGIAALLVLVNGIMSILLRLQLERSLFVASVRTIVQLSLIGFVLKWVFQINHWALVVAIILLMTFIAGLTAMQRTKRRYRGIFFTTFVSMWISSWLVTSYALLTVFRGIENWYQPQYAIPLMGMVLGNTLNGISIGLDTFLESIVINRRQIEMCLTLGATRWEAARPNIQESVRKAMIPIINSMMIVGLVSLPGMMTGQLLSGTAPDQAVRYQIVIMFLIASATALGTICAVSFSFFQLFSADHRLCADRLTIANRKT